MQTLQWNVWCSELANLLRILMQCAQCLWKLDVNNQFGLGPMSTWVITLFASSRSSAICLTCQSLSSRDFLRASSTLGSSKAARAITARRLIAGLSLRAASMVSSPKGEPIAPREATAASLHSWSSWLSAIKQSLLINWGIGFSFSPIAQHAVSTTRESLSSSMLRGIFSGLLLTVL